MLWSLLSHASILGEHSRGSLDAVCPADLLGWLPRHSGTATALLAKDRLLPSAPVRSAMRESWLRILGSTNLLLPRPGRRLLAEAAPARNQNAPVFPLGPMWTPKLHLAKNFLRRIPSNTINSYRNRKKSCGERPVQWTRGLSRPLSRGRLTVVWKKLLLRLVIRGTAN